MDLRLNDTYVLNLSGNTVRLVITGLGTQWITFRVSGEGVTDPDKQRQLPPAVFAQWLKAVKV